MQGGYGSLVGMDLGTKEAGAKFIDHLNALSLQILVTLEV